jgi:WD40 repeat protein
MPRLPYRPLLPLLLAAVPVAAAPPERGPMPHLLDLYGDPLPHGAVARLGSVRLRHSGLKHFSLLPDGKTAVTVGDDQMVRRWDLETGRQLRATRLPGEQSYRRVALCPSSSMVAIHDSYQLVIWDAATNRTVRTERDRLQQVDDLAFSPDGSELAVGAQASRVTLWSVNAGGKREFQVGEPVEDSAEPGLGLRYSLDGRRLVVTTWVTAGDAEPGIRVYDRAGLTPVFVKEGSYRADALSADGKRLAVAEMKEWRWDAGLVVRVIDLASGKDVVRYALDMHAGDDISLAFTPDGSELLTCGPDRGYLVEATTGKIRLQVPGGLSSARFSRDGKLLIARTGPRLRLWDVRSGRELHARPGPAPYGPVVASPNGRILAISNGGPDVGLWDWTEGRLVHELSPTAESDSPSDLAFSVGGEVLTACYYDGRVRSWTHGSWPGGRSVPLRDLDQCASPHDLELSPDGRRVVAIVSHWGDRDEAAELRVWNTTTGELLRRHRIGRTFSLRCPWLPDTSTVQISTPAGPFRLNTETGRTEAGIDIFSEERFSQDGWLRAYGGTDHITVREVATGQLVVTIHEREKQFDHVGLAAGWRAAVATEGRRLRVFDLVTGKERVRYGLPSLPLMAQSITCVTGLLVLPGERHALTTFIDGTALVWDLSAFPPPPLADKHGEPELRAWWDDLAGEDAARAYAAGWKLAEAPAPDLVRFLRQWVRPVKAVDSKEVRDRIAELDSPAFATREAAAKRLQQMGPAVLPHLRKPPAGLSAEALDRLGKLMERFSDPVPPAETLRVLRAVAVLERVGTNEARKVLEELAGGAADAAETRAARSALGRMRQGWSR